MGNRQKKAAQWMNLPDGRTVLVLPKETSIQTMERMIDLINKFNCGLEFGGENAPRITSDIPIDSEQAAILSVEIGEILQIPVTGMGIFAN